MDISEDDCDRFTALAENALWLCPCCKVLFNKWKKSNGVASVNLNKTNRCDPTILEKISELSSEVKRLLKLEVLIKGIADKMQLSSELSSNPANTPVPIASNSKKSVSSNASASTISVISAVIPELSVSVGNYETSRNAGVTSVNDAPVTVNVSTDSNLESVPCSLKVVPPPFILFVARLEYGTKSTDIIKYLESRNIDINSLRCQCLTPDNIPDKLSSSFKIYAPQNIGKKLLDTSIWPSNILVREFSPRSRNMKTSKNLKNLRSSTKM